MPAHPTPSYTMNARRIYAYEDTSAAALGTFHFPQYEPEDSVRQEGRISFAEVPILDGAVPLGGDEPRLAEQLVTRRFTFLSTTRTALQTAFDAAMAILSGGKGRLWRYTPNSTAALCYQWAPALVKEYPLPPVDPGTALKWTCQARFSVPLGLWYLDSAADTLYGEAGLYGAGLLYGTQGQGWSIDDAGAPYSVSNTITNRGNAWARALVMQATAGVGGLTDLTVTNSTTGHTFTQSGGLGNAEKWRWDTFTPSVKKYASAVWAYDWGNYAEGSSQRGMFALAPGNNVIVITSSAAIDADFAIEYYEPST